MPTEYDIGSLSSILQDQGLTLLHTSLNKSSEEKKKPEHQDSQTNKNVVNNNNSKKTKSDIDMNTPSRNISNEKKFLKPNPPQPDTVDSICTGGTGKTLPQQNRSSAKNAGLLYEEMIKEELLDDDTSMTEVTKEDEQEITVNLPLAGPFVHGYLTGIEEVVECYDGDYESILHETTSKVLFEISRNGGKIESQKDLVTFPLSESEAIASTFVRERHTTIKEAVRVTFTETKNNHLEIIKEARMKFEQYLKDALEEKDKKYIELENNLKKKYNKDLEELRKEHDEELLEAVNMHEKEIKEMQRLMDEEKKAHKRGLAAYLNATQLTFQRLKDEFHLDLE